MRHQERETDNDEIEIQKGRREREAAGRRETDHDAIAIQNGRRESEAAGEEQERVSMRGERS